MVVGMGLEVSFFILLKGAVFRFWERILLILNTFHMDNFYISRKEDKKWKCMGNTYK